MSHYADKQMLEDYMDRTFGQFDSPEYARALPLIVDKGVVFLSSALTTQLMRLQGVREVNQIEVYFCERNSWEYDLELYTKAETANHRRLPLFAPFNDKYIKNASYCDSDRVYEDFIKMQNIRLDRMPNYDLNSILFGGGIGSREVFSVYIIQDILPGAFGGVRLRFKKLGG